MRIRIFLLALFAAALWLTGCSSAAMTSNPVWQGKGRTTWDEAEPALLIGGNRTNIWPIYYRNGPAQSILWPFIAKDNESHAVIPFYEYNKNSRELRLGTIHHLLPALTVFAPQEEYWRVLNVFRNAKEHYLFVFPLYFSDDHGIWTPPLTWRKHTKGILGPLLARHQKDDVTRWWLPFPLVEYWKDGDRSGFFLFPLLHHSGDDGPAATGAWWNLGLLLANYNRDDDKKSAWLLAPLTHFTRTPRTTEHWIFPLYFLNRSDTHHTFVSLPWTDVETTNTVVKSFFGIPYTYVKSDDATYQTVLFPFFHRSSGSSWRMHMLFPLYYYQKNDDGNWEFFSLPFMRNTKESFLALFGPLYLHKKNEQEGKQFRSVLFPLTGFWTKETPAIERDTVASNKSGHWIFPFYIFSKGDNGGMTLLTLLGGRSKYEEGWFNNILGPLYIGAGDTDGARWDSVLFPIFHRSQEEDIKSYTAFPLFNYMSRDDGRRFLSLPFSFSKRKQNFWANLGLVLLHMDQKAKGPDRLHLLLGILYNQRTATPEEALSHLEASSFHCENSVVVQHRGALFELYHSQREIDRHSGFLFEPYYSQSEIRLAADAETSLTIRVFNPTGDDAPSTDTITYEYEYQEATQEDWLFPFYYQLRKPLREKRNVLWRVWDEDEWVREDGTRFHRARVLWKLFQHERVGDQVAMDAFPFISYDKSPEESRFSFAGGLLEYGKKNGKPRGRFLYFLGKRD
jgi:hypothetical protein